ncbi:AraC family transcriptional regulator [Cupriavidus pauculus]|uniref:AraC family transcriptional regulator n=2 Tax=Cupriavidus pauculus TaxID=82633 RepID=A0A5P2H2Z4_9BURK|nr:AraC family transcriptional regulator [Cupriavidus pauculus]QET01895.1 AraC family transcriptional regulator [Cupriavidus pauculus]
MSRDPFSDILKFTHAESIVTGGFTATGPWALRFPAPEKIKFFAVVKGQCWVRIDGEQEPVRFETGDVGLLAARRSFVLASDLDTPPVDAMSVFARAGNNGVHLGIGIGTGTGTGTAPDFSQIGGHILLDPVSGRLLADVLPPWIHVPAASAQATAFRWLLAQLVEERANEQPGTQLASAQLAQLLFIQILRAHLRTSAPMPPGWLRALGDARLAPALRLMHDDPARTWHLEDLAKACAMSRTTFAAHFRTVAGVAPLTYLTEWRMRLAERALREDDTPVTVVAQSLGYSSDSAFSTAFKRVNGHSPRAYRMAMREAEPGEA